MARPKGDKSNELRGETHASNAYDSRSRVHTRVYEPWKPEESIFAILLFRERDEGLHARLSPRMDDEYRDSYEIVPTTYSPTLDDIAYIYPYFIKRSVRVTRLKKRDADSQQGIGKHSSAGQQERPNVFETRYASRMI